MKRMFLMMVGVAMSANLMCYSQSDATADSATADSATADNGVETRVKVSLSDGSTLLGTPNFSSLTLATDFGKPQIPLALVSAVDFHGGRASPRTGTVKVTFANKDVLSGTLEDSAFKIATSFGDVLLECAHVKTMAFTQQRVVSQCEAGLLLHVPLDRVDENLGIFDARMETRNVRIVDGRDGQKAMAFDTTRSQALIHLPFSPFAMNEGTIEFWARIPSQSQNLSYSRKVLFFNIECDGLNDQFTLLFAPNDGASKSGLSGLLPGIQETTHNFLGMSSIPETGLLGDTPEGWHHYAFIWKRDGVGFPAAKGKKLVLAIDGKILTTTSTPEGNAANRGAARNFGEGARLSIPWMDPGSTRLPLEMSELKIWDHARLPATME